MAGPDESDRDSYPDDLDRRDYEERDLARGEGYESLSEMDDWDEDGAEREE